MIRRAGGDGVIVAVLGEIDESVAQQFAHLGREGSPGIALLLRTEEWSARTTRTPEGSESVRTRVISILRESGWAVAEAGAGHTVTDVWNTANGVNSALHSTGFGHDTGFTEAIRQ
jgi:hypothetical protein